MAAAISARYRPTFSGLPEAGRLAYIMPLIACITLSVAGAFTIGPSEPNPEMETYTRRSLRGTKVA